MVSRKIGTLLLDIPELVVLDEGHTPRNQTSNIWNTLLKLKIKNHVILSGTPFQNNFRELFNTLQLNLLNEQITHTFAWNVGKEILMIKGVLHQKDRQMIINKFNDPNSKVKVLLASTKSCSEGIHLVGASRVVLLDVVWNPTVEKHKKLTIIKDYEIKEKNEKIQVWFGNDKECELSVRIFATMLASSILNNGMEHVTSFEEENEHNVEFGRNRATGFEEKRDVDKAQQRWSNYGLMTLGNLELFMDRLKRVDIIGVFSSEVVGSLVVATSMQGLKRILCRLNHIVVVHLLLMGIEGGKWVDIINPGSFDIEPNFPNRKKPKPHVGVEGSLNRLCNVSNKIFAWFSGLQLPNLVISKCFITRLVVVHFIDHPRVQVPTTMVLTNNNNRKPNYLQPMPMYSGMAWPNNIINRLLVITRFQKRRSQVPGWPPVRKYRKKNIRPKKDGLQNWDIMWVNGKRYELQEIFGIGNWVDGDVFDRNDPCKDQVAFMQMVKCCNCRDFMCLG
ncbi:SNF2 domain-containing protein CLASSY 4 [Artemisia annua]|uniref:SNF2 domain-containing protein CLASSY 4 n=1 Tax=Artemisia annua TaxID=35608 RepID=A0A2U1KN06_ARTAN|nr:SNF2 domain-containing protein CLASSY 4 [Artemisia annua]